MYNPYTLKEKTILITGASSGIGQQTAIECSRLGAQVIVSGRNNERLEETLNALEGNGHSKVVCDLNDSQEISQLVTQMPHLDGLVSNAGFTRLQPIAFLCEDDVQELFRVNTIAPIVLLKRLLKARKLVKRSSVVFTSSLDLIGE